MDFEIDLEWRNGFLPACEVSSDDHGLDDVSEVVGVSADEKSNADFFVWFDDHL